jgi:hypothetical protein
MKIKHLNIPNTHTNRNKIKDAVASHMVDECCTDAEIRELAIAFLSDTYDKANHTIGDLCGIVKNTPIKENNAKCYPEQALLFMGNNDDMFFYVQAEDIQQNKVKETMKEAQ